ncbi:MAG TPA: NADH-quinone oxidoreductase subunit C [Candidatus Poseidoniaceae archaeon]|nr:MAG TPA: NADH-quinone oxidoreductase subunit C [Candidatus Poseidoniales archaeon]HII23886.1 NADH-quinone oxidoreductase subunit C [Candidatus Poseidoniaceae archaeon]|tara:strand:+ start:4732 stop:5385 length:654 start_codon:yes stop_codon:yes gene_type:complete
MGMAITLEQNAAAVTECADAINDRFSGSGINADIIQHSNAKKYSFVRIIAPPQHWQALAKWMKFELGVNYCSMITGTHFPDGGDERGWEVVYHLLRQPIVNQVPNTNTVFVAEKMLGTQVPVEFEIIISLPNNDTPSIPTVQHVWNGADWNEKETWDLVGINFEGHDNMHRVLNPHDSPEGFHPLQKQHKIRYHDYNEMYDDAQGFGRKPADEGRVK